MNISAPSNFECEKSTVYPGEKMVKVTWTNPPEEIVSLTLDIHRENSDEFYRQYGSDPTSEFLYIDIPEDAEIGKYLELILFAYKTDPYEEGEAARTRVKVVAPESENPPASDTGNWRLEQFQNSEGADVYPVTIVEGIFYKGNGKSLEELLAALTNSSPDLELPLSIQNGGTGFDTAEYGLAALIKDLNTSFASTPYTDIYLPVCVGDKCYKVPFTSIQKWTVGDRGSSASQANTSYSSFVARGIAAGTTDYTAGSTGMTSGTIYLVYE